MRAFRVLLDDITADSHCCVPDEGTRTSGDYVPCQTGISCSVPFDLSPSGGEHCTYVLWQTTHCEAQVDSRDTVTTLMSTCNERRGKAAEDLGNPAQLVLSITVS